MELINILIRTSNRPELFKRCLDSVLQQNYENLNIIISIDKEVNYIPSGYQVVRVEPDKTAPYFYDKYCNDLKDQVKEGWYFFLDDDDVLAPDILSKIPLDAPAILVQLNHMGRILPVNEDFWLGQVGMPCLILHHTLKNIVDFTGQDHGDYHYIKEVEKHVDLKFVPLVVVVCDQKGNGQ